MTSTSKFAKVLATVLCFCMLVTSIQIVNLPVYAEDLSVSEEPYIVREAIEYREENLKMFLKSDNTYTGLVTTQPIHYQDENGVWQDIDNTLIKATDITGETVYTNTDHAVSVTLPDALCEQKSVTIENDGYVLCS